MRRPRGLLAVATASSLGLAAGNADAYTVRKSASGDPVRWSVRTVEVVIDPSLSAVDPAAPGAASSAFGAWNAVAEAETPGVVVVDGIADEPGYRPNASDNRNTVRYADKGSPLASGALAVTVLTFAADGTIVDADVILNGGGSRKFAVIDEASNAAAGETGNEKKRYDVQNVLTHEVGHFLGLGEEEADDHATMFVTSARGETQKRDLSPDDELGVRSLYVVGGLAAAEAEAAAAQGSCALHPRRPGPAVPGALYALAGGLLAAWSMRRQRDRFSRRIGATLALGALLAPAGCLVADADLGDSEGDATASVVDVSSRWEGGIVVTRLTLQTVSCRLSEGCPEETAIEVLGGSAGGFTQIVGHHAVPALGDTLPLVFHAGRAIWPHGVSPQTGAPVEPARERGDDERTSPRTTLPTKAKKSDPRRAHERAPVHVGVVLEAELGELHGTTENLSEGGAFIAFDDDDGAPTTQRGAEMVLSIDVPGRSAPLRVVGEVRWVRPSDGGDEPAGVGIRFMELTGEDAAAIRSLVEAEEEVSL